MVMLMLEYALKDGGLSHESEIQQTKCVMSANTNCETPCLYHAYSVVEQLTDPDRLHYAILNP
jgi:hypothetical protein